MKKKMLLVFTLILVVMMTGCGKEAEKKEKLTCTLSKDVVSGTTMENTYTVTYEGEYVQLVETVEKVISDNSEYLKAVKEASENIYKTMDDVKYYDYDIKIDGDTLLSTTKINYEKIDYNELVKANPEMASIMKNKKLKVDDIKSLYETQLGATCK